MLMHHPTDALLFRGHVPPVFVSKDRFYHCRKIDIDTLSTIPLHFCFPLLSPCLPYLPVFLHIIKPKTKPNGDALGSMADCVHACIHACVFLPWCLSFCCHCLFLSLLSLSWFLCLSRLALILPSNYNNPASWRRYEGLTWSPESSPGRWFGHPCTRHVLLLVVLGTPLSALKSHNRNR